MQAVGDEARTDPKSGEYLEQVSERLTELLSDWKLGRNYESKVGSESDCLFEVWLGRGLDWLAACLRGRQHSRNARGLLLGNFRGRIGLRSEAKSGQNGSERWIRGSALDDLGVNFSGFFPGIFRGREKIRGREKEERRIQGRNRHR
jgi:hypothetical protein